MPSDNKTFLIDGRRTIVESCEKKEGCINFTVAIDIAGEMHSVTGTYDIKEDRFYFDISKDERPEEVQRFILANDQEMIELFENHSAQTC